MGMTKKQFKFLCGLALGVNGMYGRLQNETGNLPTVFFEYSGHVALLRIRIHTNGWLSGNVSDVNFEIYTDGSFSQKEYDAVVNHLKSLKERIYRGLQQ